MLTVKDLKDLHGKRVIVRVDFNVPQVDGVISDDNRIVAALPTIKDLLSKGARVILLSHLGKVERKIKDKATGEKRPATEEEIAKAKKKNNLQCVVARLGELLGQEVKFSPATRGSELATLVNGLKDGEVLVVQNTRYEAGEEKNDPALASEWASLSDVFVMDAFGSAHRAHASTAGIPEILKKEGKPVAVGYLVEKEVNALAKCVRPGKEDHPYIAILGGLKVSSKIKVIDSLLSKCDKIIIGGAMAYTFKKAQGGEVGDSPFEPEYFEYALKCLESGKILLPIDSKVANSFDNPTEIKVVEGNIPEGFQGLDIGPKSAKLFADEISKAKMVFWNGPMGVFEKDEFIDGTVAVCKACAELKGAFTVIGGGDSASAAKKLGFKDKFSHVSTGGGASLEMIENDGHLPGIDVIGE